MNVFLLLLLTTLSSNSYPEAEKQAGIALSVKHDAKDSVSLCDGQMKIVSLKDSVMNSPGAVGSQYSYPIYKYETDILYYKNKKIAAVEKKQTALNPYTYKGVITGVDIITTIDGQNSFYFDRDQQLISKEQFDLLKNDICPEDEEGY